MITRSDAVNEALERLEDYAYLDAPGFACHGPMGAETLSHLGHDDLVAGWVDGYRKRYDPLPAPPARDRLDASDNRALCSALGDASRLSDWAAMFREELWNRPWPDVVRHWAPQLLAGYGGALTHGLIRTAHAVRALPARGTPSTLMLDEVARGLALWAGIPDGRVRVKKFSANSSTEDLDLTPSSSRTGRAPTTSRGQDAAPAGSAEDERS